MHEEPALDPPVRAFREQIDELRGRLAEAEETLRAIRTGGVDAITVSTSAGEQVFSLKGAEQAYRDMVEAMSEGALNVTLDGLVLYSNQRFADIAKADRHTVIGSNLVEYFSDEEGRRLTTALHTHGTARLRTQMRSGDGTSVPVSVAIQRRPGPGDPGIVIAVVTDLTEIVAAQDALTPVNRRLEQANRVLHMLNLCNTTIIHAVDEQQMLADICRTLVNSGGYRLAWIGYADPGKAKPVRPVAWADDTSDFVDAARISWNDCERGCGPTGAAVRTGHATIVRSIETDPSFAPWREMARHEGFHSAARFPLRAGVEVLGAMTVYSARQDAFDEQESAILNELADDVAYSITNLRRDGKLAETRAFLNNILESSTKYSIISEDLNHSILYWNEGARRNYGYAADEIIGMNQDILQTPEDRAAGTVVSLMETAREKGVAEAELRRVRKDGSLFIASVVVTRRDDASGKPIGYLIVSGDISEKQQAEERLRTISQYARSLIEASLDPLVTISPDGKITDVNRATEAATGLPRDQLIGRDFSDYFTDPEKARAGYRKAFSEGSVTDYPLAIRNLSGRVTDVLYNASTYCDENGQTIGVFAAARDITARKQAEEELANYRRHLEDLVSERTADLAEANQALNSANHELESFAYSVSHDLRAPLRAIDGFSQMLQEDYGNRLDAEAQRLIEVVRDGVAKMARLIDDILDFSRAARREMAASVIDMTGVVRATLKDLAPAMTGRSVKLDVAILPTIRGDREMIKRVWMNLLDNAIKFTGHKDHALVEIGSYPEAGDTVYFVKDNGAGFDMAYAEKLFGVFQRLHGPEEFPGTGAGLAIVKRIVVRHGGRVWAEGRVGEGATFFFALPSVISVNV
jgi:PAS domain S-box-containing protein